MLDSTWNSIIHHVSWNENFIKCSLSLTWFLMYPRSTPLPTPHFDTSSKALKMWQILNWNALSFFLVINWKISLWKRQKFARTSIIWQMFIKCAVGDGDVYRHCILLALVIFKLDFFCVNEFLNIFFNISCGKLNVRSQKQLYGIN